MTTDQERIDVMMKERPYLAQLTQTQLINTQTQLMVEMVDIMYEQLATMKDAVPTLLKKYSFNITDNILEINEDKLPSLPWISFTLYNEGGDPVHVYVNEYGKEESQYINPEPTDPTIGKGDSIVVDMKAPKIKKIILFCENGKTATVRIFAMLKDYRSTEREERTVV